MTLLRQFAFALILASGAAGPATSFAASPDPWISLLLDGERLAGLPLLWTNQRAVVLQPSGRLWDFDPSDAAEIVADENPFQPASQAEMSGLLYAEFGHQFKVTATSHYLVVHPVRGKQWPDILERLHRAFLQFCGTRGLPLRKGRFPMVAIVFPDQAAFMRYARSDRGGPMGGNVLGYYSRASNRVAMYDHGRSSGGVSSTIRHEAAHQSAFNWGVHSRVAKTPHWIVEGIGTLFEADGIHDAAKNRSLQDRANPLMLDQFRDLYDGRPDLLQKSIERIVADDRMFSFAQGPAYAVSWAMTFYLAERRPDVLRELVETYTTREPFADYRSNAKTKDFAKALGMSIPMVSSQLAQFIDELR